MASKPEADYTWKWHPQEMDEVKARLTAFVSGWLGGPVTYPQNYGPPMIAPAAYGVPDRTKERDIWLDCARQALTDTVPEAALRELLDEALTAMAEHMRNRDGQGSPESGGCCGGGSCSH